MKWFEEMRLNVALPFATLVIVISFSCELKIHETTVLYELNVITEDVPKRLVFLSSCTNGCTISVFLVNVRILNQQNNLLVKVFVT